MHTKIREAFDGIHASQQLRDSTVQNLLQQTAQSKKPTTAARPLPRRAAVLFAAMLTLCVVISLYFIPVSAVHIETEPYTAMLQINCFNRVISASGAAEGLSLRNCRSEDAVQQLMQTQPQAAQDTVITVVGNDEVLRSIEDCVQDSDNIHCCQMSRQEASCAAKAGISTGKYNIYLLLLENGIQITEEQVQGMSMKELRTMLPQENGQPSDGNTSCETTCDALQQDPATDCSDNTSHPENHKNGNAHGHGAGRRAG